MWTIINLSSQSPRIKLLLLILPLFLDREGKSGLPTYLDIQQLWGLHWGKKKTQNPRVLRNLREMLLIPAFILDLHKFVLDTASSMWILNWKSRPELLALYTYTCGFLIPQGRKNQTNAGTIKSGFH